MAQEGSLCRLHYKMVDNQNINKDEKRCIVNGCKNIAKKTSKNENYCNIHDFQYRLDKPNECLVCYLSLNDTDSPLHCGHWIHLKCLRKWNKPICPLCRNSLTDLESSFIILDPIVANNILNPLINIFVYLVHQYGTYDK